LTNGEADDERNGKSFDYLRRPDEFRHLAPEIFDALSRIFVESGETRSVAALESSGLPPNRGSAGARAAPAVEGGAGRSGRSRRSGLSRPRQRTSRKETQARSARRIRDVAAAGPHARFRAAAIRTSRAIRSAASILSGHSMSSYPPSIAVHARGNQLQPLLVAMPHRKAFHAWGLSSACCAASHAVRTRRNALLNL
jgi:hypothetical protein